MIKAITTYYLTRETEKGHFVLAEWVHDEDLDETKLEMKYIKTQKDNKTGVGKRSIYQHEKLFDKKRQENVQIVNYINNYIQDNLDDELSPEII